MNILVTNDDGFSAKGLARLVEIMRKEGDVTVIAPKKHQSGMSTAVALGLKQIAYRELGEKDGVKWNYLDATPASCVKYGLNFQFLDRKPDVVVSGINHGSNASTAASYSGTLGAAEEAALNGVPAIGVSLDTLDPDADFSAVEQYFPGIFRKLMADLPARKGIYYNVNFPCIPAGQIKGVRTARMGQGRWVREFIDWNPEIYAHFGITPESLGQSTAISLEEGEKLYMMTGEYLDSPDNQPDADHLLMAAGYISVCPHNVDTTDTAELMRLKNSGIDKDFR